MYAGGQRDDRSKQSALGGLVADALRSTLADPARGQTRTGSAVRVGLRTPLRSMPVKSKEKKCSYVYDYVRARCHCPHP